MAEYINKHWIEKDLVSAKDVYKSIEKCPIADVVERSKIDKAIKEIEYEIYCDNGFSMGVKRALEILIRNIGE